MLRTAHFHCTYRTRSGTTEVARVTVQDAGFLSAAVLRREALRKVGYRSDCARALSAVRVHPPTEVRELSDGTVSIEAADPDSYPGMPGNDDDKWDLSDS